MLTCICYGALLCHDLPHMYRRGYKLIQLSKIQLGGQSSVFVSKSIFLRTRWPIHLYMEHLLLFYGCDFANQILNVPHVISCLLLLISLQINFPIYKNKLESAQDKFDKNEYSLYFFKSTANFTLSLRNLCYSKTQNERMWEVLQSLI